MNFAHHIDDILWRRTKMGLHLKPKQITILQQWFKHAPHHNKAKKQREYRYAIYTSN